MWLDRVSGVQTFLPYRSFASSVRCLDRQRLGKQRVETLQIMKSHVLGGGEGLHRGWSAHPAARMWAGHLNWLMEYQAVTVAEWVSRGYKDTCLTKTLDLFQQARPDQLTLEKPFWLGKKVIHSVHRANLMFKAPEFYSRYHWPEAPMHGYWWPVRKDGTSGYVIHDL